MPRMSRSWLGWVASSESSSSIQAESPAQLRGCGGPRSRGQGHQQDPQHQGIQRVRRCGVHPGGRERRSCEAGRTTGAGASLQVDPQAVLRSHRARIAQASELGSGFLISPMPSDEFLHALMVCNVSMRQSEHNCMVRNTVFAALSQGPMGFHFHKQQGDSTPSPPLPHPRQSAPKHPTDLFCRFVCSLIFLLLITNLEFSGGWEGLGKRRIPFRQFWSKS